MPYDLRNSALFDIVNIADLIHRTSATELSSIGLQTGQDAVLKTLADEGPLTIGHLAELLQTHTATVANAVFGLYDRELVTRVESNDAELISLTDAGKRCVKNIDNIWKRLDDRAFSNLKRKERKRIRKSLEAVGKRLARA